MTELIPLRLLKTTKQRRSKKRSYKFKTAEPSSSSSDSSDDDSSSNDESPFVLKLPSKSSKKSKRKNMIQTLPLIINTQPAQQKKKHHRKNIQQFLINTQPPTPPSPKEKDVVFQQIIGSSLPPEIQYVPVECPPTPVTTIVERPPFGYPRYYSPTVIEEPPYGFYRSYDSPVRRIVRVPPLPTRSVRLPRHAKKIVNRFLSGMEYAHGRRYIDGSDSDCSIDDCRVCHRLRYEMGGRRRRSTSEMDLYRGSRIVFEKQEPHRHNHRHSKNCNVCNLLEKSDFVISTTKDHSKTSTKKQGKHVHVVESFPSNIKPAVETTTTTTTTSTQPKVVVNNPPAAISSVPTQSAYYPLSYTGYADPNTGTGYAYDPNWQYNQPGGAVNYDYSSYYTNPAYIQSNLPYETYNTTVPVATDPSTTRAISPNPFVDKGTYTHMKTKRKKHKPVNKTVVVHTSRNPTPPTPKIIIEQPRPPRLPRKLQSTTVLKERSTQTPHTTTTTYVRT